MSNYKLAAAKEFIEAKQYNVARNILEAMTEDATAKKWLIKLNELYPKPKSIQEMTDEELIEIIERPEVVDELFTRLRSIARSAQTASDKEQTKYRQKLREWVERLCKELKIRRYPESIFGLLAFLLKTVGEYENSPLPEPPELALVEKLLYEQDNLVQHSAHVVLASCDLLSGQLAVFPRINPGLTIKWSIPHIKSFSSLNESIPIINVFKNDHQIFDIKVHQSNDPDVPYILDLSTSLWLEEHPRIAPVIFKTAFAIFDNLEEEAFLEREYQSDLEEADSTYDEDIAPYLDDYEENWDD